MAQQPKRIEWITSIKGICIMLVFLSHGSIFMNLDLGYVRNLIEPVYVNAFFFVSGYLFFRKYLSANICKSAILIGGGNCWTKIILPSILFALISYFPKYIIKGGNVDIRSFVFETIGGCTYWFTSALVVAQLLFLIVLTSKSRNIWLYVAVGIVAAVLGKLMYEYHINIFDGSNSFPWMYKQGLICALYFAVGGLYMKYESSVNRLTPPAGVCVLALFYLFSVIFFYNDMECTTSMCMIDFQGAVVSFVGCILLARVCRLIPKSKVLDYIGNQSLGFYFLSGAIPLILSIATIRFTGTANYVSLAVVFILSLALSWIIVKAILKYAPWAFNFKLLISKKSQL